jgi:hypothetical protein
MPSKSGDHEPELEALEHHRLPDELILPLHNKLETGACAVFNFSSPSPHRKSNGRFGLPHAKASGPFGRPKSGGTLQFVITRCSLILFC